jgi:hypothetical protein
VEVNAKMIPVETTPGIKGVRNENGWEGKFKYDIFDILYEPV